MLAWIDRDQQTDIECPDLRRQSPRNNVQRKSGGAAPGLLGRWTNRRGPLRTANEIVLSLRLSTAGRAEDSVFGSAFFQMSYSSTPTYDIW